MPASSSLLCTSLPRATSCRMISTTAVVLPVPAVHKWLDLVPYKADDYQDAKLDTTLPNTAPSRPCGWSHHNSMPQLRV